MSVKIRRATGHDIQDLEGRILRYSSENILIPRSSDELGRLVHLERFFVAEVEGRIIGSCGINLWQGPWVEIISLTVDDEFAGQGLGTHLVQACLQHARSGGHKQFFTLTERVSFFERMGFRVIPIQQLPHKIEADCANCPLNAAGPGDSLCKETALVLEE